MAKKLTFEKLPEAVALLLEEVAEIKKILRANSIPSKNKAAQTEPSYEEIDLEQVCAKLNRTKQTVYAIVKSGALKPRKQGRKLLFTLKEVEKYAKTPRKKGRKRKSIPIVKNARAKIKSTDLSNENESAPKPVEGGKRRGRPPGKKRN